jgi:hypothetical protein
MKGLQDRMLWKLKKKEKKRKKKSQEEEEGAARSIFFLLTYWVPTKTCINGFVYFIQRLYGCINVA